MATSKQDADGAALGYDGAWTVNCTCLYYRTWLAAIVEFSDTAIDQNELAARWINDVDCSYRKV